MSLLKACNGILADVEEMYALFGFHVKSAKKRGAALSGLRTVHGLPGMLEIMAHNAVHIFFPFLLLLTDRSIEFETNFDPSRGSVQLIDG